MTEPARDETVHIVEGYIEINHPVPARLAKALIARIRQQDETIKRMDEALKPFDMLACAYDPPEDDDNETCWGASPTLGQLRAARAARKEPT